MKRFRKVFVRSLGPEFLSHRVKVILSDILEVKARPSNLTSHDPTVIRVGKHSKEFCMREVGGNLFFN